MTRRLPAPPTPAPGQLRLPPRAWRLLAGMTVAAVAVALLVLAAATGDLRPLPMLLIAAGVVIGEALRVDVPCGRNGSASFGLSDTALTAGLLLLGGHEVVLACAAGMLTWQLFERAPPARFLFNFSQYLLGLGVAALVMELLAPRPGPLEPGAFLAVGLGMLLFFIISTSSVGAMIALTARQRWAGTLARLLRPAGLLAIGNVGLGLIAVLLAETHPWAVPAILVPMILLYSASRGAVRAQVDRERSQAYVALEQSLGDKKRPEDVALLLIEGAGRMLGCKAAVWLGDRWVGPVPDGSGPCPVDPELSFPLVTRGPGLGPAVEGDCAAIGLGRGLLVIWGVERGIDGDVQTWLERLARAGRAHFERAAAASALDQERATLQAVVDGTADGICVLDADGIVRLWNLGMARLVRRPTAAALGRPVWDVLGEGPWTQEGTHEVERDGGAVWRVSVASVEDATHGALQIAVVHDVSHERRLARMKDDMLAVASHELRTPLTPVKASAQLLRRRWDRMDASARDQLLERIEGSADHLTRLVGDILLVGQLSGSEPRLQIRSEKVEVVKLLSEIAADQQQANPAHVLSLHAPDELRAVTDPARLRQIVENLLDNACKFSSPGSEVELRVRLAGNGERLTVVVADEGRGIPPSDHERVFERFERVEDPLVMTTSGAGLGLYIVRKLAEALSGEVTLDSTLGVGTQVTVDLPRHLARTPRREREMAHTGSETG